MATIIRGKTPENIEQLCLQLCADYLSGHWLNISRKQLIFKRITGGFTNQMYFCSLPYDMKPISCEPKQVVIKFYGEKHFKANDETLDDRQRFTDGIISLTVANSKLGPEIYGLFPSGQIMEFIEHKRFDRKHQNEVSFVKELAQKLAKLHSLKVPIKKTNNDWYLSIVDICLKTAYERYPIEELIDKNNLKVLRNNRIAKELDWIRNRIIDLKTPIVFCHNDFRGGNIMVRDKKITEYERLLFCDLENCRYGYRGVDFATIFGEWGRELSDFRMYCESVENNSDPQEFTEHPSFPSDSTLELFISFYIEESVKIYGTEFSSDDKNSLKSILAEVKPFSLLIKLFTVLAFLQQNEGISDKELDKLLTLVSRTDFSLTLINKLYSDRNIVTTSLVIIFN